LYEITETVVEGTPTAVLHCRKCEYKEPITSKDPMVYEHILSKDKVSQLVMNPYLKFDPTLQHLTNIVCPNTDCPSRTTGAEPDVVAVKLNEKLLIWMYQCTNCDFTWKKTSSLS